MANHKLYFFLLLSVLLVSSCSRILGIRKIKPLDNEVILKSAMKCGISEKDLFVLDSSYYNYIFSFDRITYKHQIKNHYQPLQALYFDKNGKLTRFYINCYTGGIMRLKWNRDGRLNTFLPKEQAPVDTLLDLPKQLRYIKPVSTASAEDLKNNKYDYVVAVYWNKFMLRHSKWLVKEIKKNLRLAPKDKAIRIIYINNDNFFAKDLKSKSLSS